MVYPKTPLQTSISNSLNTNRKKTEDRRLVIFYKRYYCTNYVLYEDISSANDNDKSITARFNLHEEEFVSENLSRSHYVRISSTSITCARNLRQFYRAVFRVAAGLCRPRILFRGHKYCRRKDPRPSSTSARAAAWIRFVAIVPEHHDRLSW